MNKILKAVKDVIMNPAVIITILIIGFLVYKRLMLTSATDIATLVQNDFTVIDVRTPGEFESGHVDQALNIPLSELGENPPELPKDKEKTIFLYCASGARSGSAVSVLKSAGYTSVHNLGSVSRADSLLKKNPRK